MASFRKAFLAAAVAAGLAGTGTTARAVVINEVDYDNPGTDTTEFVELFNNTASAVSLAGYSLVGFNGGTAGNPAYRVIPLSGTIAPGAFFVIGNVTGANVDPTVNQDLLQNGATDAIGLYSSGTFVEGTTAPTTTGLVAGVVYEGQGSFPAQFELILVDDNSADNASLQRSPLTLPVGAGAFAFATPPTPGLVNSTAPVPEPASLGMAVTAAGMLLLRRRADR